MSNERGLHVALTCGVELRKKNLYRHGVTGCAGELKLHFAAFAGDIATS